MTPRLGLTLLCGCTLLAAACATKSFVTERLNATEGRLTEHTSREVKTTETRLTEQVTATETKLAQRVEGQEAQAREAADRARANREAIESVGTVASGARTAAESAVTAARDTEARLAQRIADRNKYRVLDTKAIHFDSGRADIRGGDVAVLEEIAESLKEDPNAILELQGFADPSGSEHYNNQLTRDRVDAVIRFLVQRHGIELRQLRAAAMGATALNLGPKSSPDPYATARRVDMRLVTPWSSWEDRQAGTVADDDAVSASPATIVDRSAPTAPIAPALAPRETIGGAPWRGIVDRISPLDLGARD